MKKIKEFYYEFILKKMVEDIYGPYGLFIKIFAKLSYIFPIMLIVSIFATIINPMLGPIFSIGFVIGFSVFLILFIGYFLGEKYFFKNTEYLYLILFRKFIDDEFGYQISFFKKNKENFKKSNLLFESFIIALKDSKLKFNCEKDFYTFDFKNQKFTSTDAYIRLCRYIYLMLGVYTNGNTQSKSFNKTTNSYESKNYEALRYFNLKPNYTKEELKKAYKLKLKKVHPDNGGSNEEFLKAKKYFEML